MCLLSTSSDTAGLAQKPLQLPANGSFSLMHNCTHKRQQTGWRILPEDHVGLGKVTHEVDPAIGDVDGLGRTANHATNLFSVAERYVLLGPDNSAAKRPTESVDAGHGAPHRKLTNKKIKRYFGRIKLIAHRLGPRVTTKCREADSQATTARCPPKADENKALRQCFITGNTQVAVGFHG